MRITLAIVALLAVIAVPAHGRDADPVPQYLQDISVTVKAPDGTGSGVVTNVDGTCYVLTAGHVAEGMREGKSQRFSDGEIVRVLVENGRTVGEMRFSAEVLRYSALDREDLAILRVRKSNFATDRVKFDLEPGIPALGTELFHVGSLLGQQGSNSLTTGIYSQVGRLIGNYTFDQTTVTAFPGSSGGGVYRRDGRYVGMLVRGAGETFNLIVPIRRIRAWAERVGMSFIFDPAVKAPDRATIDKGPVMDKSDRDAEKPDGAKPDGEHGGH